ncbi:MAG: hypothetical protein PF440_05850 [Thiomicrorhabdus sp.]|jgi:ribosomal protein S1|nr:hypothetical protein [Thiomicrorhabdus sp.]
MKKRVVILASGNVIPMEKDEYDKAQTALNRNTGRNIVMNDGGIIRTVNIEYVGIVDDEAKAPSDVIERFDVLNARIVELDDDNKELSESIKDLAKKAVDAELEAQDNIKALKDLKKINEGLLEKIGIAEANLKAEQVKKPKSPVKK